MGNNFDTTAIVDLLAWIQSEIKKEALEHPAGTVRAGTLIEVFNKYQEIITKVISTRTTGTTVTVRIDEKGIIHSVGVE